jgi:cell division protein FtsI (penicillin-binding protein 3)
MVGIDRRIGLLFGVFLVLLTVGLARAAYLGSFRAGALQQSAQSEQVTMLPLPAPRGEIVDSTGQVLALSEAADDVIADPLLIAGTANGGCGCVMKAAQALSPILGIPVLTLSAEFSRPNTGYVVLAKLVPAATALRAEKAVPNGINLQPDMKRVYPLNNTAAQVLGWTAAYLHGQGDVGLEAEFNSQLNGSSGVRRIVHDAAGQPISVQDTRASRAGKTIKLTLNAQLQNEVEQVLAGVGRQYSPVMATAIVMNPQTGAILALANWPSVNANDPFAGSSTPAGTAAVNNAIQDHAVALTYEPGSTFKAFTVAGALQDGLITPSTNFDVPPQLSVYGSTIRDAEAHGYLWMTTAKILQVSSNIGADLIGQKLGALRFNYWVHRFGFGRPTGVDLPGEDMGYILDPSHYSGTSMWNLPFGQGESVTPMQMAAAYSAIANGGILRSPHVVASIGGKSVPQSAGARVLSPQVAAEVRQMLIGVYGDTGTASGAGIPGYQMAGKTGTAQIAVNGTYSKTQYVASFVGMVPASNPQLLGMVVVDQPQGSIYGGSVAAPAFQKIVGWAVPYFGINPR